MTVLTYTSALLKLCTCADIKKASPAYGRKLAESLGDQYSFRKYLARGGEGPLLLVYNSEKQEDQVAKFCRPKITPREGSLWMRARNALQKDKESTHVFRFRRGAILQQQLHNILVRKGLTKIGYIPEVYHINRGAEAFFLQEYIPGEDYLTWLRHTTLSVRLSVYAAILELIEKVLHDSSIVYSDVKPDNILILRGNVPCLLDFGIAKNLKDVTVTVPGETLCSPIYSNRQQRDNSKNRAYPEDIYSLGILLWITYAGKEPDYSHIIELNQLRVTELFTKTRFVRYPELGEIFDKMTSETRLRYTDIIEVREVFEAFYKDNFAENVNEKILSLLLHVGEILGG